MSRRSRARECGCAFQDTHATPLNEVMSHVAAAKAELNCDYAAKGGPIGDEPTRTDAIARLAKLLAIPARLSASLTS